ncbi:MAG: hypothetical protein D4R64_13855 [Porphyromonadaceae bacterium]|nr:MAG: hypothetical protein D4R64_13855 [Porphyromonadaceae bacterium]
MKSTILSWFLVLCLALTGLSPMVLMADEVTKNQALTIADQVVKQYFPAERQLPSASISISASFKTNDPFYVCNVGETGYVLVSKSDNCPPVLGFSWESNFPARTAELPVLMNTVLDNIRTLCDDYASRDTVNPSIMESWKAFSSKKSGSLVKTGIVAPLLATSWNCDSTFFDLFPKDFKNGGSVPIAMGQVFRYFAEPFSGTDELCYILNGYGELCTQFNQARLRFDRMSNTLGNPAVDSLIYYMAVTCMLQPEGASLEAYKQTLPVHFGYSPEMRAVESWNYNIGDVIHHQLTLRRPVPAEWLGQAFVIDGYFPDNLYHFNMGWGGQYNGFYLLDYPVVKVDTDHSLLTCYTDYHPKSLLPVATNLTAAPEGDSIRVSWNTNMNDSLRSMLVRFVVLRDGLIPIAETTQSTVVVSAAMMGGSSGLRVVADFGINGASELSVPFLYISDQRVADIPSLALRILINTKLGASELLRQPFVGELELIKDLEINFTDQRGLEKLPQLRNLRIDGTNIRTLRDGDYLQKLQHLRFYKCIDFDYTIFSHTRSLIQLYGYDYLPTDLYEFRHNADLGMLVFTTTGTNPNMLMDLYGADKYFPKLADFFVRHLSAGISANYEDCFVSYESYLDIYPKIKSNLNLLLRTKPTSFAPCYPTPARNINLPSVSRISWQANFKDQPGVYYNVFVGNSRRTLELVSVFQLEKYYDGTFEPNTDYFWRIEAYHTDSTYYSGVFHFSTWQDLPIPFIERFDDYYSSCPVADESPFWINFDNTLTGKAVTNRNIKFDGFYSLELKPRSDAGVLIKLPVDPVYYIEFRFLNQGGQVTAELLQKSGSSDDNIVNSKIDFQGKEIGLFTYEGSTFPFNFVPDQWNRVNISLNMNTGLASLSLNEVVLKEWQWHVQIGGAANTNPFKGIRFVNNVGSAGGSGFIDNLVIDVQNPLSTDLVLNPEIGMVYLPGSREVMFTGVQPDAIRDITLYDIQGRKMVARENPDNLIFPIGSAVRNGIYVVVVNRKDGRPFSRKIAVLD